jgi:hypothetical protein
MNHYPLPPARSGGVVTTIQQRSTNNSRSLLPRCSMPPILDRTDVSFTPATTTMVLLLLTACTTTAMMTWTILYSHKYTQLDDTTTPPTSSDTPPPTTTTTFVSHLPRYILQRWLSFHSTRPYTDLFLAWKEW